MAYHKALPGVGFVSLVPSGTYPDPVVLSAVESFDISTNEDTADLENDAGDVIDSFVTKRVIEGTITLKDFSGSLLAAATRGVTVASGTKIGYQQQATVPAPSGPYTITVTNSANYTKDLGVINLTTGKPMQCNDTAADATGIYGGTYSVAAGVYTFHSAQASASVLISYEASNTGASTSTIAAAASSTAQSKFGLHLYQTGKAGKNWGIYIPAALIPGISAKFAKAAWSDVTMKWKATLDGSGNLAYYYSAGE